MGRDIWGKWVHLMRTQFILRGVYPNSIAVSIVWSTFGRFDLGHMGEKGGGGDIWEKKGVGVGEILHGLDAQKLPTQV